MFKTFLEGHWQTDYRHPYKTGNYIKEQRDTLQNMILTSNVIVNPLNTLWELKLNLCKGIENSIKYAKKRQTKRRKTQILRFLWLCFFAFYQKGT